MAILRITLDVPDGYLEDDPTQATWSAAAWHDPRIQLRHAEWIDEADDQSK